MKQLLLVLTTILTLASCHFERGSGNIISENRKLADFKEITVGSSFDVEVKMGATTDVRVEADDNVIKYIETEVSGNTLKIGFKSNHGFSNTHLKVFITTPELTSVKTSASASVNVEGVLTSSEKLKFKASSSSDINADVDAPEVEAEASSSGTIKLSGKTKTFTAAVSSSGDILASDLMSENTKASASSSGTAKVHASVTLDAKASSSGDIVYHGGATVSKSESSSGSVEKRD